MIDPRLLSTPLGAAVGVVLSRKLLPKSDRSFNTDLGGAGIGAGAGFLAGQYMKGDPVDLASEDPSAYIRYLRENKPTGPAPFSEINTIDKIRPIYTENPGYFNKKILSRTGGQLEQNSAYVRRAEVFRALAAKAKTEEESAAYTRAAVKNEENARNVRPGIGKGFISGWGAGRSTLGDTVFGLVDWAMGKI